MRSEPLAPRALPRGCRPLPSTAQLPLEQSEAADQKTLEPELEIRIQSCGNYREQSSLWFQFHHHLTFLCSSHFCGNNTAAKRLSQASRSRVQGPLGLPPVAFLSAALGFFVLGRCWFAAVELAAQDVGCAVLRLKA